MRGRGKHGCFWLGLLVLIGALLTGPLAPGEAAAGFGGCRTDPIVLLSNGTMVALTATIQDDPTDIRGITYRLHVPSGVSADMVVYTGGALQGIEAVDVVADNAAGAYDTDTLVSTAASDIPVTATMMTSGAGSASISGSSGQTLHLHLSGQRSV